MSIKVIIGIGNPDEQYAQTRHNIGFMAVDFIAKKFGAGDFKFEKKINSEIVKIKIGKKTVLLSKPQTFVNKIGDAARKIKNFYKLKPDQILVIHDDLDIDFGKIKFSFNRGSGGHKGVESVVRGIKSNKFYRLRIGLANNILKKARNQKTLQQKGERVGHFVLSKFTSGEQKKLPQILKETLGIISKHFS